MKIHFRPKTEKKRKWPNSPFSAQKTKTNFGRLLVWWLDLNDPEPLRFYDRSTPLSVSVFGEAVIWQYGDDYLVRAASPRHWSRRSFMNAASVVYQSLVYVFVRTGNYAVSENSSNNFLHVDFCTTSSITIHWCVSLKIGKTLASCSFDKYGLILIIFGILANSISRLSKMMCLFNFPCPFTFTYFICFFNSTDGNNAKRNVSTCFLMVSVAVSKLGCIILFFAETADTTVKFCWRADWCYQFFPRCIVGNVFVFQQNSAPAHRALVGRSRSFDGKQI